jgi:hypothetical protein
MCFALIEASGGLTPAVIAASVVGLAAAAAFVAVERRARHPMLPLELFRSRHFASANLLALVTYAALGGVIFLFVAFLQTALGYSALRAGAATLPITLLLLALSTPSGAITQRIGPRIPLTIGAVLAGAAALLAWMTISNDALNRSASSIQQGAKELPPSLTRNCPVAGTPLAAKLNSPPSPQPATGRGAGDS